MRRKGAFATLLLDYIATTIKRGREPSSFSKGFSLNTSFTNLPIV